MIIVTRWTFGATFQYSTGRPITLANNVYEYGNYRPDDITERNGYKMFDFHRLDLSATFNPRNNDNRRWKGQWVFSIYNVYNRKNPWTIYTRKKSNDDGDVLGDGTEKKHV